jgi:N-acetyl sugar amidotransferase
MKHCTRCVMPDTRPGIKFNSDGVCYPCLAAEKAKATDWSERYGQWKALCKLHQLRHKDKAYDSILPCSGGKDSHVQALAMVAEGLNPLCVCVSDWFGHTQAGLDNFREMCEHNKLDSIIWRQNPAEMREMAVQAFFEMGSPTWPIDAAIYSVPLRIARMLGVELIVYGEDIAWTYGGPGAVETPSAARQFGNDVVKPAGFKMLNDSRNWLNQPFADLDDMAGAELEPVYLSYFLPWDGNAHADAARRTGFRDCSSEWQRQGCIEDYDQIDSKGYMVHPWLKYPKFGHARATDVASNLIRHGYITREEGVELVRKHDHVLDPVALQDFLRFTGISAPQFWARVDDLYNRELFDRDEHGVWRLREPVR